MPLYQRFPVWEDLLCVDQAAGRRTGGLVHGLGQLIQHQCDCRVVEHTWYHTVDNKPRLNRLLAQKKMTFRPFLIWFWSVSVWADLLSADQAAGRRAGGLPHGRGEGVGPRPPLYTRLHTNV